MGVMSLTIILAIWEITIMLKEITERLNRVITCLLLGDILRGNILVTSVMTMVIGLMLLIGLGVCKITLLMIPIEFMILLCWLYSHSLLYGNFVVTIKLCVVYENSRYYVEYHYDDSNEDYGRALLFVSDNKDIAMHRCKVYRHELALRRRYIDKEVVYVEK